MRFKGLDLNLLVALDVLLTERNVSHAAAKLHLSQSATSGALARLRDYFGDELLVQVGRKMLLTPRATALAGKVRAALVQIDGTILRAPDFDPATAERNVRLIASDYVTIAGLREAMAAMARSAPRLSFALQPPNEGPALAIERGEVDLIVMPEINLSPEHPSLRLFTDDFVVLAWAGNTRFGATMSEDEFYAAEHVTVRFATFTPSYETWFMRNRASERHVACIAGSYSALPFLLVETDRVCLLHHRLARIFADILPLRIIPSPVDIPPLVECLQWNVFSEGDDCLTWVREQIVASATAG